MGNLSINIDMGASNNGVFVAVLDENSKITQKFAFNVHFDKDSINFSKLDSSAKPHTRRNYDRKKFVNRLLDEIFATLSQNERQKLYSLTKNRGFTFLDAKFDGEISDEIAEVLNKIAGYKFHECKNKNDFLKAINEKIENLDSNEALDFLKEQKELLLNLLPKKDKTAKKELKLKNSEQKQIKQIAEIFDSFYNEIYKNSKHRKKYFIDIENELKKPKYQAIIAKTKFSKTEFLNLICNISNLQTRTLRRYFNAKFDANFDDKKLFEKMRQNALNLHYKSSDEKKNLNTMRENFKKQNAISFLTQADPEATIPPFEDRNNINPLKCQSLLLKNKLTPNLQTTLSKIVKNENFEIICMDQNGEINSDFSTFSEAQKLKYMQRFLDISKDFLNDSDLYPRDLIKKSEIFKRVLGLNDNEMRELKNFANLYYDELNLAKKGIFKGEVLKICNTHTPYKNNCKFEHLTALFRTNFSQNDTQKLENFINDKTIKIDGRKTLNGFLNDISEIKKDLKNYFYYALENKIEQSKEVQNLLKNYEKAMQKLNEFNPNLKFKEASVENIKHNFNLLSQLSDILLDSSKGFNKTCINCTIENRIRSGLVPFASRLGANSARLINGRLEMFLDRLAYEIFANIKSEIELSNIGKISVNIEQNRFNFEKDIKAILKSSKKDKENKNELICPYSGEKITFQTCEFDHIIARHGEFNETFNDPANLIAVNGSENLNKSNKRVFLENLNEKYLTNIYEKAGVSNLTEFKEFIRKNISLINEKTYTNFYNLKNSEQIAFSHALFLPNSDEAFKKAINLLRLNKLKTASNGTQKRLSALLYEKFGTPENFSANFIDAKIISATRSDFAKENEKIKKQKAQDFHSHCIDAMCVFYANSQEHNFSDIYLDKSKIITPSAKKFLELPADKIKSKNLFDETIYEIGFDMTKFSDKKGENFNALKSINAIKIKQKGKIRAVLSSEIYDENAKYFIDKNAVFSEYFRAFEAKDIQGLEKLKFLDDMVFSSVRKDIFEIFFDKTKLKKLECKTENIAKFYEILKKNENKLIKDNNLDTNFIKELYRNIFYTQKQLSIKRLRDKNRVIYSLKVPGQAKFVIRRNDGFEGLTNKNIATKAFLDNGEIKTNAFYSKNVLPLKVADILDILKLSENAKPIYKLNIPQNLLPNEIKSLNFVISQASRHDIKVAFKKQNFPFDIDGLFGTINLEKIDKTSPFVNFANEWLNGKFKDILGKPRNNVKILTNNAEELEISYCVEQTSKANKTFFKQILDETSRNQ